MRRIRSHLTYANVTVTILAFVVLGGGTAMAAVIITSNSQVAAGTISGHHPPTGDHANIIGGSVDGTDLATGAVTLAKVANDAINSPKIIDHSVTSADLSSAAWGARAYGYYTNTLVSAQSKNVVAVNNPSDGIYCIRLAASIDPTKATVIASTEFASDNTSDGGNQVAHAEWYAPAPDCPSGQLEVRTWLDFNDTQIQNVNGCAGCTVTDTFRNLELTDQGFSFVVP